MLLQVILFALFRLLQAIGCGIIPLVTLTLIAELNKGTGRASAMANYQIFLSCAPAIAPILGSSIGARWDYSGIFSLLLFISIILFIAIFFTKLPNAEKSIEKTTENLNENYMTDKVFLTTVILGFLVFLTYFSILVYLPILLSNIYYVNKDILGILFLPITVSLILGSLLFKRVTKKYDNLLILKYTVILLSIFTILFALFNSLHLVVLTCIIFIIGLIVGIIPALLSTIISQRFENIKGKVLGIFNFVRYIGMAIGAIIIGSLSQLSIPYYFIIISIIFIFIFIYIQREGSKYK